MRKISIFLSASVLLVTSALSAGIPAANAALTTSTLPACTSPPVAPLAMNPIPADDNCGPGGASSPRLTDASGASTTSSASATTPISATPLAFDTTNGDILAITKIAGAAIDELAFGGSFTAVITPDRVSHPAQNFAVVNEATGAILYAGSANSYVRAIGSYAGAIYVGGDFTTFGGMTRSHLAALDPAFAVTSFNPAPSARVRAVQADAGGVYYGGDGATVKKTYGATGTQVWSQGISGGSVKAIQISPDGASIFVGGLFEVYGGLARHGIVKASAATGAPIAAFNAHFRLDSGIGSFGSYDGEEGISFTDAPEAANIIVGIGGHGSDEVRKVNMTTGTQVWNKILPGDCQAVVTVSDTYVSGYHRNHDNTTIPYPYFAAQLEGIDDALIQPYSGHASRQSLELYSRLSIAAAQQEYDRIIPKFPV